MKELLCWGGSAGGGAGKRKRGGLKPRCSNACLCPSDDNVRKERSVAGNES